MGRREDDDTRTTAVVTYRGDQLVQFTQTQTLQSNFAIIHTLKPNTDLNETPTNWLRTTSEGENYVKHIAQSGHEEFSSFKMAHCFSNMVPKVEVVSDASSLKHLFRMAVANQPVSLMVHRVGNSLLIDEFDAHKHLLRSQVKDWEWLQTFYDEKISSTQPGKLMLKKDKSLFHLRERNMYSKFLYRSLVGTDLTSDSNSSLDSAMGSLSPQMNPSPLACSISSEEMLAVQPCMKVSSITSGRSYLPALEGPDPTQEKESDNEEALSPRGNGSCVQYPPGRSIEGIEESEEVSSIHRKLTLFKPLPPGQVMMEDPDSEDAIAVLAEREKKKEVEQAEIGRMVTKLLPDPYPQKDLLQTDHQRSVYWKFEDIRMLVGTDLPIFGSSQHPCVTLKLREMEKPIGVVAGMDMWLDNIICDVPELAMCYHVDGIVQYYDVLKTEEIPRLENSKFDPEMVRNFARNVFDFLQYKCTKEGHTYWLVKGADDDIIKLYDLTSLVPDLKDTPTKNPFAIPVALLLHRLAKDMHKTNSKTGNYEKLEDFEKLRQLLDGALAILKGPMVEQDMPQVLTSLYYMEADTFVPDSLYLLLEQWAEEPLREAARHATYDSPLSCVLSVEKTRASIQENMHEFMMDLETFRSQESRHNIIQKPNSESKSKLATRPHTALDIDPHTDPDTTNPDASMLVRARLFFASGFVQRALGVIDVNAKHIKEGQVPQIAIDPRFAIPLYYMKSKREQRALEKSAAAINSSAINSQGAEDNDSNGRTPTTCWQTTLPPDSWHSMAKMLLMRKSAVITYGLALDANLNRMEGKALRLAKIAMACFGCMVSLGGGPTEIDKELYCQLMTLIGDLRVCMGGSFKNREHFLLYFEEYHQALPDQVTLLEESAWKDFNPKLIDTYGNNCNWIIGVESNYTTAISHYTTVLDLVKSGIGHPTLRSAIRRLGNAVNELALHLLEKKCYIPEHSTARYPDDRYFHPCDMDEAVAAVLRLDARITNLMEYCVALFKGIGDDFNCGLVMANWGRAFRVYVAMVNEFGSGLNPFLCLDSIYYKQSIERYNRALKYMERSKEARNASGLIRLIWFGLNSSIFTQASLLQEVPHYSKEVEHCMLELYKEVLVGLDLNDQEHLNRAANTHHRLATLYHKNFRVEEKSEIMRRHYWQMLNKHYESSIQQYEKLGRPCEQWRVTLEMVSAYRMKFQVQYLADAITKLIACRNFAQQSIGKLEDVSFADFYGCEITRLIDATVQQLNSYLLFALKDASTNTKRSKLPLDKYKVMYAHCLRHANFQNLETSEEKLNAFMKVMEELSKKS